MIKVGKFGVNRNTANNYTIIDKVTATLLELYEICGKKDT